MRGYVPPVTELIGGAGRTVGVLIRLIGVASRRYVMHGMSAILVSSSPTTFAVRSITMRWLSELYQSSHA